MDKPALVPLAYIDNSSTKVGEQLLQLAKLQRENIPVAPTVVILKSTLEKLALEGKLSSHLQKIITQTPHKEKDQEKLLKKLQLAIQEIALPQYFIKEILEWHDQNPNFVRVFTADKKYEQQNINGNANLIESILDIWSQQIQLDFQNHQVKLFAQPLILQYQDQPQASGVAHTKSTKNKSQLSIASVWGVYDPNYLDIKPDIFEVDIRTQQITTRQLFPQHKQLYRKRDQLRSKTVLHYRQNELSLNPQQIKELAHLITTIKRKFLTEYSVHWSYENGQFLIHQLEPDFQSMRASSPSNKVLLTGDSLQGGIISGEVLQLKSVKQLTQLHSGQILVTSQFKTEYLPALKKISAIICDHGVANPSLIKYLVKYAVPTIINTRHATRYLKNGSSIMLDANAGQILTFKPQAKKKTHIPITATKVYISAGNPHKAEQYVSDYVDGIGVLRSEYTFASLGEHPRYLLSSRRKQQLRSALKKTITTYRQTKKNLPLIYRTLDLTSQELLSFSYANSFEPIETNPYLGYRGSLRILNNFDLLDLEVEVLQEVATQNNIPLGLMIPFVRTPSELRLIKNYLQKKHHFTPTSGIGFYLQLNTPENIFQMDDYLKIDLSGVSLNTKSIHALMHGIDPDNPDIFSLYPYDMSLMEVIFKKAKEKVRDYNLHNSNLTHTKLILHLEHNNLRLVELATKIGFDIITVKPEFAPTTKKRIREIEEQAHA